MVVAVPSRRRAIENVASALFRERGYAATSVRDIARALDIQGASLYSHVTSKQDVLWSIVDRAAGDFEAGAELALAQLGEGAGGAERLSALVQAHVTVIAADPGLASVFVHEWRHLSPERRATVLARRDAYEHRFRQVVEQGMAAGEFVHTDPAVAVTFILTALNGLASWYRPEGRLAPHRIADHYAALAVRSLVEDHR